ncbi:MAG: NfeD family protein [Candidatus Eremiobacteraeota bacterium]|nr:NfeD family protein [Candidatus Eremiobacteraeota bacterium]
MSLFFIMAGGIFTVFIVGIILFFSHFILKKKQTKESGYTSSDERTDLEGSYGVAQTDLRPYGVALINDERVDVTTSGEYIQKGTRVQVVKVDGMKVVVKSVEELVQGY